MREEWMGRFEKKFQLSIMFIFCLGFVSNGSIEVCIPGLDLVLSINN